MLACVSVCLTAGPASAQWPQFRGPNGSGVDSASNYPVEFSPTKNALWKTAIPYAQSSPVVAGNRVYVTASEPTRLLTICLDAKTGRELWRRDLPRTTAHKIYTANDPASPTPVADETGVFVFFPDFGLAAYTPEGKQRWTHPHGPFKNFYGMSASPILAGGLLIQLCDQLSGSFLLALDPKTGHPRWNTPRPAATIGWATPMVFRPSSGPAQLIVLGTTRLDSYYLSTGESRWWTPIGSGGSLGTPVAAGDTLLVSTAGSTEPYMPTFETVLAKYDTNKDGRLSPAEFAADKDIGDQFGWVDADNDGFIYAPEWKVARELGIGEFGAIAIQPGAAQGQLAPTAIRWRFKKNLPYIPAPLFYRDVYFMVRTGGVITSLDPLTGKLLKEGRTREALGEYYASPVAADGKVFVTSAEGKLTVVEAKADWQILGVNDLGEEIHATPALGDGRIYVRTRSALYCFANPAVTR